VFKVAIARKSSDALVLTLGFELRRELMFVEDNMGVLLVGLCVLGRIDFYPN
jgi:hypothetical protein